MDFGWSGLRHTSQREHLARQGLTSTQSFHARLRHGPSHTQRLCAVRYLPALLVYNYKTQWNGFTDFVLANLDMPCRYDFLEEPYNPKLVDEVFHVSCHTLDRSFVESTLSNRICLCGHRQRSALRLMALTLKKQAPFQTDRIVQNWLRLLNTRSCYKNNI